MKNRIIGFMTGTIIPCFCAIKSFAIEVPIILERAAPPVDHTIKESLQESAKTGDYTIILPVLIIFIVALLAFLIINHKK